MINLILFGPPGAGKGTQAAKLAEHFGLHHLSTGDIFRREMAEGSELGKAARSFIEAGKLVPDDITIGMLRNHMTAHRQGAGFVLDGFPRTLPQAEALNRLMAELGFELTAVISLEVDDAELLKRLRSRAATSGRADDADDNIIRKRLEVYKNETLPLKDFYRRLGVLHEVEGVGAIEKIFSDICSRIQASA
jgi:adenylate kinase